MQILSRLCSTEDSFIMNVLRSFILAATNYYPRDICEACNDVIFKRMNGAYSEFDRYSGLVDSDNANVGDWCLW